MCNNGCTHHHVESVGGQYYYCAARKEIFSYLREKVNNYRQSLEGGETDDNDRSKRDIRSLTTSRI